MKKYIKTILLQKNHICYIIILVIYMNYFKYTLVISFNILPYDGTDYKRFLSVKSACTIIAL